MFVATLVNIYQLICVDDDGWCILSNFDNYKDASKQAYFYNRDRTGRYYVSTCDPLKAIFKVDPPEEYSE